MDEDDHGMSYDMHDDEDAVAKAEPTLNVSSKSKKTAPSENKSKPKSKKSNAKSWSASATSAVGGAGSKQVDASAFSFHRMRTLMKTQASVQNITHDATFLVAKATELFIRDIAYRMAEEALASNGVNGAHQNGSGESGLVVNYDHLAEIVHSNNRLAFLKDFVPHKVVASQVLPDLNKSNNASEDVKEAL